uniref:Uncharacterized protein n=1 Tax=Anguilla anguilla TaxID=7936 RepID=A0A0E9VFJ7_ANGAN
MVPAKKPASRVHFAIVEAVVGLVAVHMGNRCGSLLLPIHRSKASSLCHDISAGPPRDYSTHTPLRCHTLGLS